MSTRRYSFIIPVFNRPEELEELLSSLEALVAPPWFEVVVIEDGSEKDAKAVCERFSARFPLHYFYKENSGPGDSRNFGMRHALGDYFIILDSDCLLPPHYLTAVEEELKRAYCPMFGGPDKAHPSFNSWQKAVSYSMTSPLSTGGIRGGKKSLSRFQPRSFNMGMEKSLFEETAGFGDIHPGEDPDLSLRVHQAGHSSRLFPEAYVYHKRRIDTRAFLRQVYLFGLARPLLNKWHPTAAKVVFYLPSLFFLGLLGSLGLTALNFPWFLGMYGVYAVLILIHATLQIGSLISGFQSVYAVFAQLCGYGWGFLKSKFLLTFKKESPEILFPQLYRFKKKHLA